MLSPWTKIPDDFVLEEYLTRYAAALEAHPADYAGSWADACHPLGTSDAQKTTGYREVRLDLGCGKGAFTVASALAEPDVLFIGMDIDPVSVACAARMACDSPADNVVFVPGRDGLLERCFAPGELATIYLNFPTPHPKGRDARARLTNGERLQAYRRLLRKDGLLELRTDNYPFYTYTLAQLQAASYEVLTSSEDARDELPDRSETAYERRAVQMGARICAVIATPGARPADDTVEARHAGGETRERSADGLIGGDLPESLYEYLPDDLEDMEYVPPEMARGIAAIRRTRAR